MTISPERVRLVDAYTPAIKHGNERTNGQPRVHLEPSKRDRKRQFFRNGRLAMAVTMGTVALVTVVSYLARYSRRILNAENSIKNGRRMAAQDRTDVFLQGAIRNDSVRGSLFDGYGVTNENESRTEAGRDGRPRYFGMITDDGYDKWDTYAPTVVDNNLHEANPSDKIPFTSLQDLSSMHLSLQETNAHRHYLGTLQQLLSKQSELVTKPNKEYLGTLQDFLKKSPANTTNHGKSGGEMNKKLYRIFRKPINLFTKGSPALKNGRGPDRQKITTIVPIVLSDEAVRRNVLESISSSNVKPNEVVETISPNRKLFRRRSFLDLRRPAKSMGPSTKNHSASEATSVEHLREWRDTDRRVNRKGRPVSQDGSLRKRDESIGTSGESIGTSGESIGTSGESIGTSGESIGTSGESIVKSDESIGTSGESIVKSDESIRTNESTGNADAGSEIVKKVKSLKETSSGMVEQYSDKYTHLDDSPFLDVNRYDNEFHDIIYSKLGIA